LRGILLTSDVKMVWKNLDWRGDAEKE